MEHQEDLEGDEAKCNILHCANIDKIEWLPNTVYELSELKL